MSDDRALGDGIGGSAGRIWAIALNTFREAVRNRVMVVLFFFAVALMAFSLVLGELSLNEEERIIKDLGLAGVSIFSVLIALFLGVNLLSKELDKKTVYAILPKPLHRWEFLIGKYFGIALTMTALIALMSAVLGLFVLSKDGYLGVVMLRAEILLLLEVLLLCAVALFFASFSSPYLSAMLTGALWVIGRNSGDLSAFAGRSETPGVVSTVVDVVLGVFPDFRLFYISGANLGEGVVSVHESFVGWGYVLNAAGYAGGYSLVCLSIAVFLFSRRDFT
jgi:ABC-type transport system involved in multi-copper enzyme maturation permease subunit